MGIRGRSIKFYKTHLVDRLIRIQSVRIICRHNQKGILRTIDQITPVHKAGIHIAPAVIQSFFNGFCLNIHPHDPVVCRVIDHPVRCMKTAPGINIIQEFIFFVISSLYRAGHKIDLIVYFRKP